MLVLSRHTNESIQIGDDVLVCVVSVGKERVRLGIDAPRYIPVHRAEVAEDIKAKGEELWHSPSPEVVMGALRLLCQVAFGATKGTNSIEELKKTIEGAQKVICTLDGLFD